MFLLFYSPSQSCYNQNIFLGIAGGCDGGSRCAEKRRVVERCHGRGWMENLALCKQTACWTASLTVLFSTFSTFCSREESTLTPHSIEIGRIDIDRSECTTRSSLHSAVPSHRVPPCDRTLQKISKAPVLPTVRRPSIFGALLHLRLHPSPKNG